MTDMDHEDHKGRSKYIISDLERSMARLIGSVIYVDLTCFDLNRSSGIFSMLLGSGYQDAEDNEAYKAPLYCTVIRGRQVPNLKKRKR